MRKLSWEQTSTSKSSGGNSPWNTDASPMFTNPWREQGITAKAPHPVTSPSAVVDPWQYSGVNVADTPCLTYHNRRTSSPLDASRGMVALSQDLTTTRYIYGSQRQQALVIEDPYPTASSVSSMSASSTHGDSAYHAESASKSVADSIDGSSFASLDHRILPVPQSLNGLFNSKVGDVISGSNF